MCVTRDNLLMIFSILCDTVHGCDGGGCRGKIVQICVSLFLLLQNPPWFLFPFVDWIMTGLLCILSGEWVNYCALNWKILRSVVTFFSSDFRSFCMLLGLCHLVQVVGSLVTWVQWKLLVPRTRESAWGSCIHILDLSTNAEHLAVLRGKFVWVEAGI